jgi:broad specificity phosphatase PhoE
MQRRFGGDSMELIFIRHGHGEHLLDYPNRLNTLHPGLTDYGTYQVNQLRNQFEVIPDDLVIVSPTKRTIQTAQLLMQSNEFFISPFVCPRMFPQSPEFSSLNCDRIYSREEIFDYFKDVTILDFGWIDWGEGINRIDQLNFESYGMQLLEWCFPQEKRVIIISHDGTITNYRTLLGEKELTREDFLGETGIFKTNFVSNSKKA